MPGDFTAKKRRLAKGLEVDEGSPRDYAKALGWPTSTNGRPMGWEGLIDEAARRYWTARARVAA